MIVFEITSRAYQRKPGKSPSFKFRCTSGPRKGQVRASPASCNAPINIKAKNTLSQTRRGSKASIAKAKTAITKRSSAGARRVASLNKPRKRSRKI
tara:strand:- start:6769 stop:7056 length:288 start_codon:yes stop_codon:yes gene_type:complete